MRRASFVVAATTALTLGSAGQGWATTSSGDITASWGDRTRIEVTWVDRNSFHKGTLTVADQTCDDKSVYATLTVRTGSGATLSLGDRHNTGGCGTSAGFRDIRASDPSGIRSLTMTLCRRSAGATDHCETRYLSANPYFGFPGSLS
ncbi:hypothetical protein E2C00_15435 [Streptomyces sp. WAC05374]|uniref:hypothetical protein n=1 Tax=Streptomyces sp. WAC05374 TaxID=2487420 RepID=UPI000F876D2B|nr:hypothetical protein [Streptomyces sp. WAC05374]RST12926.1 hypothetical protein EF905_21505 [Streptomyces sp. WAC05374]TDF48454.1 hypothetical protein E2B92_06160 [Streptomyces sp. WAC05374]TDF54990.1 hypothetical protein E2C02_16225 [Streptomyces sp. WAC05374]TDF55388.1 hypothetical protein E2C00_15435 [Streptomyces sp. WAC05374]